MNGLPVKFAWPAWYWLSAAAFLLFLLLTWQVLALGPHAFDMACALFFQTACEEPSLRAIRLPRHHRAGRWGPLGALAGAAVAVLVLKKKRFLAAVWLLASERLVGKGRPPGRNVARTNGMRLSSKASRAM